jgi:4,5-DOPA dioxygenase extradiol
LKGAPLRALGEKLQPRAVLVVSAHWESAPACVGSVSTRPLMYDFGGFPEALYHVEYPAPGAPELARRVGELLGATREQPDRPLDHGVWTPLVHMFPRADRPVLQVSLPSREGAASVFALGQKLAPLRDEGVLLIGSGNLTHNLRTVMREGTPPERVYQDFDAWAVEQLDRGEYDALIDAKNKGPHYRTNHPTDDHYLPLLFTLGSASAGERASYPVQGWEYGNLSRRAVLFS